jgi:Fe-S-cluster containining protein
VQSLFCRKLSGGVSLKEKRPNAAGQYDCIFLMDDNKALAPDGSDGVHQQRKCGVYEARPLQCRTWPFWPGNLASREAWEEAAGTCPGINRGRLWTLDEIIARRDARDWPE